MEQAAPIQKEVDFLKKTNDGLVRSLHEMIAVKDAARRIAGLRAPDEIVARVVEIVGEVVRTDRIGLYLKADAEDAFYPAPGTGASAPPLPEAGVVEWALREGKPTTLPREGDRLLTLVPLALGAAPIGLLCVDTTALGDSLSPHLIEMLGLLANQAAASLQYTRLLQQLLERNRSLEATRGFLANILDSITNGILTVDRDSRITRINRNLTAMLEWSDEAVMDRPYAEVVPETLREILADMFREVEADGFTLERQYQHRTTQGPVLPLAIGMSRLMDEAMQPIGTIVVFRDMTASQELERMRQIDQLKSQFVSNVSHELRTPLTSIRAYTEALLEMLTEETQRHFLQVIDEESERLLHLIEDLLNVGRIEAGKLQLKLASVDPKSVVMEVMGISKVQSTKHRIVLDIPEGLPAMQLDKPKMKEVMINLMSNAVKYSPKGGDVRIAMALRESNLEITVTDQGMGIPKDKLPNLFQLFYRVDSSLTAEIGGTGLGLAIARAIVQAHGGKLTVDSEVGVGSTFAILLPVRREATPDMMDNARQGSLLA